MVDKRNTIGGAWTKAVNVVLLVLLCSVAATVRAKDVTINVVQQDGTPVSGFRWLVQEDVAFAPVHFVDPGNPTEAEMNATLGTNMHPSYIPVVQSDRTSTSSDTIEGLDDNTRYYVSVLPDQNPGEDCQAAGNCFSMSGKQILAGVDNTSVIVTVTPQPLPTAQVFVRAFEDIMPINNAFDTGESALGGFTVFIYDGGGQMLTDVFGNPIGTVYDGLNTDNSPRVMRMGDGTLHTMTEEEVDDPHRNPYSLAVGELLIKNLAPGKYGVRIVAPYGEQWQQTSTIEGTPGLDVWVKAGEPRYFAEFGPAGHHAEFGFVQAFNNLPAAANTTDVVGQIKNLRIPRVSTDPNPRAPYAFSLGHGLAGCWVGLNDLQSRQGLYVAPCDEAGGDGSFTIPGVPDGSYQLVVFDSYLDLIFNQKRIDIGGLTPTPLPIDVGTFRWFGTQEHYVYFDADGDGVRDEDEAPIPEQAIVLRYKDGSVYAASATDNDGYLPLEEVFPFFAWLVAEVDYARFKPTGLTVMVDATGDPTHADGKTKPQVQNPAECVAQADAPANYEGAECIARTETGPALTEAFQSFLSSSTVFEWGKQNWGADENGGIGGIVFYATTRAENDPRYAAGEPWEPGIPRVQISLYRADADGNIDGSVNGGGGIQFADVDNYPLGWQDGGARGPEDFDQDDPDQTLITDLTLAIFDQGDAIEIAHTDSFDDSIPQNCPGDADDTFHLAQGGAAATEFNGKCYESLRNFNQVRPGVFDGGFGLGAPFSSLPLTPGFYVVEAAAPPNYQHVKEQSKNVDYGDTFTVDPLALPPICVGDANTVAAELTLFPGISAPFAGDTRPGCNRKLIQVSNGKNAVAEFFLYTPVPVAGQIRGFVLNDVGNEFDPNNLNFGEKYAPSFIPISVRDHEGNEVYHTTTDAYGMYNAVVPSTYRINTPTATGVSPNMLQVCLNSPFMEDPTRTPGQQVSYIPDPNFNKQFSQFCYTFNFQPGQTTYLDTPVLPISAFASGGNAQLDCECTSGTPRIQWAFAGQQADEVSSAGPQIGTSGGSLTLRSVGVLSVPDPDGVRADGANQVLESRDYGFGATEGTVSIGGVGVAVEAWSDEYITVTVPGGSSGGQVVVTTADSVSSKDAISVIVSDVTPLVVGPGQSIQAAIDATDSGGIVMVKPGYYQESLFMTRPIQLQGWGAFATVISPVKSPTEALDVWRQRANELVNCTQEIGLLPGQENNSVQAGAVCGHVAGTGLFPMAEGAGILIAPKPGVFDGTTVARIDGFTVSGADQSGGIVVNGYADFLQISNNILANNQATTGAGGIRIGLPGLLGVNAQWADASNDYIEIHHNRVVQNGSLFEPGAGVGLYNGSDYYRVTNNYICGNFAQGDGGGIAHYGLSDGGIIADNLILLNQSFDQTAGRGGNGGGVFVGGQDAAPGTSITGGSGSVKILRNHIQGNNAGSGDGGGIELRGVNGADVVGNVASDQWQVDILNNTIVQNVAAGLAGGISIKDAVNVRMYNNTVMNNDSTGTNAAAFCNVDLNVSCPQAAGIVAFAHSGDFAGVATGPLDYSNPDLRNNIVLGNQSWFWQQTPPGSGGFTTGVLSTADTALPIEERYQDFSIEGSAIVTAQLMGLNNLVMVGADFSDPSSVTVPNGDLATTGTVVVDPRRNGGIGGVVNPGGEFPILAAAALDEGGNFIDVQYGPLSKVGDYHLLDIGTNIALDAGATTFHANASPDIDGDARAYNAITTNTADFDIGSDEIVLGVLVEGANQAPVFVAPRNNQRLNAYLGVEFNYRAVAVDPNDDAIIYTLCRRANCTGTVPVGLEIDAASGIVTWPTPGNGSTGNFNNLFVVATDANGEGTSRRFRIRVSNANAPTAADDQYRVNRAGIFNVGGRGVLRNDTRPGARRFGATTSVLVSQVVELGTTDSAGSVSLNPNGTFMYDPLPSFVGEATFTYKAVNAAGESADATVTLVRQISVTDARFVAEPNNPEMGRYHFSGFGTDGDRLRFRVRGVGGLPGRIDVVAGQQWDYVSPLRPLPIEDATARVIGINTGFRVNNIPLFSLVANSAPLSTAFVQCPGDSDGDGIVDVVGTPDNIKCVHLAAGDGYSVMADGTELYGFSFNDVTGTPSNLAIDKGMLNAQFPAPTMEFNEGDEAFVTITNVGMLKRPDLFDPHSLHFHGFPNAATVFDGVPESSVSVNMGFSLSYYYNIVQPGTFMYHCHVEATEHMQMGMLGNLYVHPAQNGTSIGGYTNFVYNDGDGSTGYDVAVPIQIGSFDRSFHEASHATQPLPFAEMHDDYPLFNGRGYPDTKSVNPVPVVPGGEKESMGLTSSNESSQKEDSRVVATVGDRILLRLSNLNVTQFSTITASGLKMKVVGAGAHILRGPSGLLSDDLSYETSSVTLGGGEAVEVMIDTTGVAAGTYFLYSTNLHQLSNGEQELGGMMTEIVISN